MTLNDTEFLAKLTFNLEGVVRAECPSRSKCGLIEVFLDRLEIERGLDSVGTDLAPVEVEAIPTIDCYDGCGYTGHTDKFMKIIRRVTIETISDTNANFRAEF